MAYTLATAVSNAQRTFPDLQTARGIDLANQVHREILAQIPEAQRWVQTITPVANQQEYPLAENYFQVGHVEYVNGSVVVPISGTTVEALDQSQKTWRNDPAVASYTTGGETGPQFYVSSAQVSSVNTPVIGFYPTPNFTVGTFNLYCSMLDVALLTSASTCLITLLSSQVYVEGIRYYAATELRPEVAAAYKAAYAEQIALNRVFLRSKNADIRGTAKNNRNPRDGGYPELP